MTAPQPVRISWSEARSRLPAYVGARVAKRQAAYRLEVPAAIATLARLRRLVDRKPGEEHEEATVVDESVFGPQIGDEPTRVEWAVHLAMCLHAVHQQSHRERDMHQTGPSFGAAVGSLTRVSASESAVRQRWRAVSTAIDVEELVFHMRGLIGLFRQARIALDYGRLAADLFAFQEPGAVAAVRRTWGRDFYRAFHAKPSSEQEQQ